MTNNAAELLRHVMDLEGVNFPELRRAGVAEMTARRILGGGNTSIKQLAKALDACGYELVLRARRRPEIDSCITSQAVVASVQSGNTYSQE